MTRDWRGSVLAILAAGLLSLLLLDPPARAYVEAAHSLGQVVNLSSNVVLLRVTAVDRSRNAILFAKVRDIKGTHRQEVVRHNIGKNGFEPREWQTVMAWADVGKEALFFHNGGASETCIGNYWYQCYGNANDTGENAWWSMTHAEPFLLRTFAGKVDKLAAAVAEMLAGKEVVVPCMVDGNKDDLKAAKAKIQRLRASLKLNDYNAKRDFVGWGGEDFQRLAGMPGFTHISTLPRVDPDAQAISAADFNADGKVDFCLAGAGRVALMQNSGESLNEVGLPGAAGCRAAVWADYNGDGLPDLLLATPSGPRLYTNLGKNGFRDDSRFLPKEPGYNLTCAAWIDQDGDGRPDILLGNGWHGLRLYRNKGPSPKKGPPLVKPTPVVVWEFEDVSDAVGLGEKGIGSATKGDTLTVCDLDGDGRADFLYGAGQGIVARNTGTGFAEVADSGIRFDAGKVGPVFGDYDGDGRPDLFVPLPGGCKLFRNEGRFKFADVTSIARLNAVPGRLTSAAWGDVDNDGHLDLVVGRLGGANRFLRNRGDGTFEDASAKLGLDRRVFNTQAVALLDVNGDGVLDMVFANEGQDGCVLLGSPEAAARRTPVTLRLTAKAGAVGSRVLLRDRGGRLLASQHVSGGEGRGGQSPALARFALTPGTYRVEWRGTNGETREREIVVASSHVKGALE